MSTWGAYLTAKQRRRFSAEFKFKVGLAAAKGARTINELAGEYEVHPNQICQWKRELLANDCLIDSFTKGFAHIIRKPPKAHIAVGTFLAPAISNARQGYSFVMHQVLRVLVGLLFVYV